jgi:hypothetical protein
MKEALKLSLEAITQYLAESPEPSEEAVEGLCDAASMARKALAQPEQEPVAWRAPNWGHSADDYVYRDFDDPVIGVDGKPSSNNEPLYTHPPQRTEPVGDDIASIIACRDMLDAQPVPPQRTEKEPKD